MTTLIQPTKDSNGVIAVKDRFNGNIYNLRKVSISGRDNGLIARFNSSTRKLNRDGGSNRSYKSYKNIASLESICINKLY